MDRIQILGAGLVLVVSLGFVGAALRSDPRTALASGDEHQAAEEEHAEGPHHGRLLSHGDFAVEVTIFERGVPPHFRVYPYSAGEPLDAAEVSLTIELQRLGNRVDVARFRKENNYLRSDIVVEEPHSFDVVVTAERAGQTHNWTYPSHEGRVAISDEAIEDAGLVIEEASPATIRTVLTLYGRVGANQDRQVHVSPRYSGLVKDVRARLGDNVKAGDVLAVVQSNDSLQSYKVLSPIDGTVIEKDVATGEFSEAGTPMFLVTDLRSVWIDLNAYSRDASHLKVGQLVTVAAQDGKAPAVGKLDYLAPIAEAQTQTTRARIELPNADRRWRPGVFVTGEVVLNEVAVPVAVRTSGLQTFRDWDVVFLNEGNLFEIRPLQIGRRDAQWVEVLAGLQAGQRYVTEKSFLIKADIEKSGASHDH